MRKRKDILNFVNKLWKKYVADYKTEKLELCKQYYLGKIHVLSGLKLYITKDADLIEIERVLKEL